MLQGDGDDNILKELSKGIVVLDPFFNIIEP
jgi:hypothetical protein